MARSLEQLASYFAADSVNHKNPGGLDGTRQLLVMLFEASPRPGRGGGQHSRRRRPGVGTGHHARHPAWAVHGAPASGKAIAATTVNELRLEDGKVAEEWGADTADDRLT